MKLSTGDLEQRRLAFEQKGLIIEIKDEDDGNASMIEDMLRRTFCRFIRHEFLTVYPYVYDTFLVVFGKAETRDAIIHSGYFVPNPHPLNHQEMRHQRLVRDLFGSKLHYRGKTYMIRKWPPKVFQDNFSCLYYHCIIYLVNLSAHCWTESVVAAMLSGHFVIRSLP